MQISVIGLGWYGEPLALELIKLGHKVLGTTRTEEKKQKLISKGIGATVLSYPDVPNEELLSSDIIILNVPPFDKELDWFKQWNWNKKSWVIFIGSTGVLKEQEEWIKSHFQTWTILRFGGLIGNGRHPGKHLSGRKNLPGKNWPVNLIDIEDTVGVTIATIQNNIKNETIECVADEHPAREEFYTNYCRANQLPLPEFDQNDESTKTIISNEKMRAFYRPRISIKAF